MINLRPENDETERPPTGNTKALAGDGPSYLRDLVATRQGKAVGSDLDRMVSDATRLLETQRERLIKADRDYRIERATAVADLEVQLRQMEAKGEAAIRQLDARHREDMHRMVREIDGLAAMRDVG